MTCIGRLVLFAGLVALTAAAPWLASFAPQGSALARAELPFYSHVDLVPRWDGWSRRRTVGALTLTDQAGRPFDERMFTAGPTIVSFFFSRCLSRCPISTDLLRAMKLGPNVLLISDQPLLDPPAALAAYARKLALPPAWRLGTGDPRKVYAFARRGLFTDVEGRGPDGGPLHAETDYLIDRKGRLRGVYAAASTTDLVRLEADYRRLLSET